MACAARFLSKTTTTITTRRPLVVAHPRFAASKGGGVGTRRSTSLAGTASASRRPPPRWGMIGNNNNVLAKPLKFLGETSVAQVAGHLGFILSIYSFSQTDVLDLRRVMLGATACGTIFQYYRPVVDTRYRWNLVLFGINAFMAAQLYHERHAADRMSDDLRRVYEVGEFESHGFSRVEFHKLFKGATRRVFSEGRALIKEGVHPNVYFLVKGSIDVRKNGMTLARLEGHDEGHLFLGEMTLMDRLRSATYEDSFASADAIVVSPEAVVYEWGYEAMLDLLAKEHEVQNALLAYISFDLQDKLHEANAGLVQAFRTGIDLTRSQAEILARLERQQEDHRARIDALGSKIEAHIATTPVPPPPTGVPGDAHEEHENEDPAEHE